ncbi:MAG: HlyD family secretion protein [Desulfobacterota bacterium]|nr:HlyD family secretion protein [Thermodesulfobacteriota bacterium]
MGVIQKWRQADLKSKITNSVCAVAMLIAVPWGIHWLYYRFTHAITDDAFVESDLINITPRVSGHIQELLVDESHTITKDQILALLDPVDYQAQYDLAQAKLERAYKNVDALRVTITKTEQVLERETAIAQNGIITAQEDLRKTQAHFERIDRDYKRIANLYETRSIAKHQFDAIAAEHTAAEASLNAARVGVTVAQKTYERVVAECLVIEELRKKLAAAEKEAKEAEKGLEVARLNLEHTKVKSPINGVVAKKFIHAGDFVSPGFPIFSVYDMDNVFVRAHLEETKLKGVKLGQMVDLDVDAFPRHKFHGRVIKIGDATGAKFMLIPRDTTTGEFTKVVQRIPIKIEILDDPERLLKPGYSVTIGIKLD